MKRYEYEQAVFDSDSDAASKQILAYYGFRKNWADNGKVWVSAKTIARDTGLSVSTVNRRIPLLKVAGWLVPTGRTVGNGAVEYDLALGEASRLRSKITSTSVTQGSTSATGSSTPVTGTSTTVSETDKQVSNKQVTTKEEVTTGADTPVNPSNNRVKESSPPPSSSNRKPSLGAQLVEEATAASRAGAEHLERMIRNDRLTPSEAEAAREKYADRSFKHGEEPLKRAVFASWESKTVVIPDEVLCQLPDELRGQQLEGTVEW